MYFHTQEQPYIGRIRNSHGTITHPQRSHALSGIVQSRLILATIIIDALLHQFESGLDWTLAGHTRRHSDSAVIFLLHAQA